MNDFNSKVPLFPLRTLLIFVPGEVCLDRPRGQGTPLPSTRPWPPQPRADDEGDLRRFMCY